MMTGNYAMFGVVLIGKDITSPLGIMKAATVAIQNYIRRVEEGGIQYNEGKDILGFVMSGEMFQRWLTHAKPGDFNLLGYAIDVRKSIHKDTVYFGKIGEYEQQEA